MGKKSLPHLRCKRLKNGLVEVVRVGYVGKMPIFSSPFTFNPAVGVKVADKKRTINLEEKNAELGRLARNIENAKAEIRAKIAKIIGVDTINRESAPKSSTGGN